MPNRKASRNAFYFFVQEKMPELRRQGLSVSRVADAAPYCSSDWMLLREEEKKKYTEMAREWRAVHRKDPGLAKNQTPVSTPLVRPGTLVPRENVSPPDVSSLSLKNDQGEIPRGFRFHCQAASDSSHKIPISNFEFGYDQATVLQNLCRFIHTNPGGWPPIYCKSNDRARVNWCLQQMAKASQEIRQNLELLTVEDLVVEIYQQKFLKEPSKTWVRSLLDVAMWDYSSNTRCKWHEENDILFCALAVCKKIAYCISNSLATLFGIQLTEAHIPLQDYEASNSVTPKMVVLDAGRYQKLRVESPGFSNFCSPNPEQRADTPTGDYPSGVKIPSQSSSVRGRGITRLLESLPSSSGTGH
ncbi:protein maelstrom homolog isoform X4 [Manis javanica]|uniref:protein maelstrom homolog isoform X4 n=1 Tax=Manis javanica TaxID=9974 RepID=UPI003C6D8D2D